MTIDEHEVPVAASIGILLGGSEHGSPEQLLRDADLAMYQAKEGGKARYEVFDPSMNARVPERLRLENDLRRSIERGGEEFVVHYQPEICLHTGRVAGLEALVRWKHPERGLLLPSEFIPLAEEIGLIVPIGRWVLEEACRRAREWQVRFDGPLTISVNLSSKQFRQRDLAEEVAEILRETGLEARDLVLEITESVAMRDVDSTFAALRELKGLGVRLAIDDFGTGHSSLSYLIKRFRMDLLKIDGALVRELVEDPENTVILAGLVGLARTLGLEVVAEGIETAGQLARVRELECDLAQGRHIAEPLESDAVAELLLSRREET